MSQPRDAATISEVDGSRPASLPQPRVRELHGFVAGRVRLEIGPFKPRQRTCGDHLRHVRKSATPGLMRRSKPDAAGASALHLARDGAVIEHQLVAARIGHDLPAVDAFSLVELRRDDDPHSGLLHLIHGDQ